MAAKLSADLFFTPALRARMGRYTLFLAIASFLVHLGLYGFYHYVLGQDPAGLLSNPINAIYTPFSFLLVYEAYLLLYYLQHSTTIYVGKQYEIIVLILIRGVFKDMTHLDLSGGNLFSINNLELWYDLGAVMVLFALILLFYRVSGRQSIQPSALPDHPGQDSKMRRFINSKKNLSGILFFMALGLGIYALGDWLYGLRGAGDLVVTPNVNAIFFDHFFTLLILGDVLILLFSLFYTDDFPVIIRNSSFVISTILLKLSFGAESGIAQVFIVAGVGFGVVMSAITTRYLKTRE
ncbi:MAG: hypothetical protein FJX92_05545 [Bacteroidetes bacterium]|nr:hypothetical protein [Bacteroidota bacterium]